MSTGLPPHIEEKMQLFWLCVMFTQYIAQLALGACFWEAECDTDYPKLYLVVSGTVGAFSVQIALYRLRSTDPGQKQGGRWIGLVGLMADIFHFVWLGLGFYWSLSLFLTFGETECNPALLR